MSRKVFKTPLVNRTNRAKLSVRPKPYSVTIEPGIALAYRRTEGGVGSWSVLTPNFLRRFALADDREDANGNSILSYPQAYEQAIKIVRGGDGDGKPVTVAQAVALWATELEIKGGRPANATTLAHNLKGSKIEHREVTLLKSIELAQWRDDLWTRTDDPIKLSSANRIAKSLMAALNLVADRNPEIKNRNQWKTGLKKRTVRGETPTPRDDYYLPDSAINAIVAEAYASDAELAPLLHVLAVVGCRESQALKLHASDIVDTDAQGNPAPPSLMIWQSEKGRADREPQQYSVAITSSLCATLKRLALTRGDKQPLLEKQWNLSPRFRAILKTLGLDEALTAYVLRHSSIIRGIFSGKATYLIAKGHDTSEQQISSTYGRFLEMAKKNSDQTRLGLLTDDIAPPSNVVPMIAAA